MRHRVFPIFFLLLGAADAAYGVITGDNISVFIGVIIVAIAISILRKKSQ